ncbi:Ig-like domain-containing protein [Kitasatospora sp. NPDC101801]|uniref:Ig-like domain-containing protein n=1 Tax=Kitasatospora sp. NPDC101801 TaxID=3364103 RepID=UPI00382DB8CC
MAAITAAGLLLGWNTTLLGPAAEAQQTPDSWTAERRAVLPSGLGIQFDFAPLPGVTVRTVPGKLATGGPGYADGLRGGDPATGFELGVERPVADGSWRTLGTLQLSFGRAVRNPRLHLSGLAALATGKGGTTGTASRLTVTGGSPSAPSLVARTDWAGWTVGDNALTPTGEGAADGTGLGSGTLELSGTVSTVTFRVEQRSTAREGSTTAPAPLAQAYTVTLDEGVGTAPQGYGNASHLVSDVFLGRTAAGVAGARPVLAAASLHPLLPPGDLTPQEPAELRERAQPMVEVDGGAARRSPWANPAPPALQPGRGEYQGADPTVQFPAEAAIGRYYDLTVPVSPGPGPATLAGWIDFDHNGRFDAAERVQSEVLVSAKTARLEWTVPGNAAAGETWARLRIARNSAQLVTPGGFADSGEVTDQRINLTVGAARPEITGPVSGAVVADVRPEIRGEGGVQGATVAIMAGDATLCRATVGKDGRWSCRPDAPLPAGAHTLTPVETTKGGVVLRGEEARITVKTAPPAAPVLTLPEYTNDPGLLLTGTGDPGSTVSVVDAANAPGAGRIAGELCSTAVAADRSWSCLPVENLADGRHQLTAAATDGAGNRTAGAPAPLTVDTVAPPRPVLGSPAAGAELTTVRPRLTGRAEPGSTVTVTTRGGTAGERVVLCTAVTGVDGAWSCTPARDLTAGEQSLVVTATDRAGNATSADAVTVTARPAAVASPSPTPSPSPSAVVSALPSVPATPSGSPTVPAVPSAAVPSASAAVPTAPSVTPSPSPALPVPSDVLVPYPSPTGVPSASGVPSPSASVAEVGEPFSEPMLTPEEAAAFLPIVVPPVSAETPASPAVAPAGVAASSSPSSEPAPAVVAVVPSASAPSPVVAAPPAGAATPSAEVTAPAVGATTPVAGAAEAVGAAPAATAAASPSVSVSAGVSAAPSASASSVVSASPSASVSPVVSASPSVSASPVASTSPSASPAAGKATKAAGPAAPGGSEGSAPERPSAEAASATPTGPEERNLAAPPVGAERPSAETWRTAACGVLLMLVAVGLLTRRVFGRGSGGRRRR